MHTDKIYNIKTPNSDSNEIMICRFSSDSYCLNFANEHFLDYIKFDRNNSFNKNIFSLLPFPLHEVIKQSLKKLNPDNLIEILDYEYFVSSAKKYYPYRCILQALTYNSDVLKEYQIIIEKFTSQKKTAKFSSDIKYISSSKNINNLSSIATIMADNNHTDSSLQKIAELIPHTMNDSEYIGVLIDLGGNLCKTTNYQHDKFIYKQDISLNKKIYGTISLSRNNTNNLTRNNISLEEQEYLKCISVLIINFLKKSNYKNELNKIKENIISIAEIEKSRIKNFIHSSIGQLITALGCSAAIAQLKMKDLLGTIPNELMELSKIVKQCSFVCRQAIRELCFQRAEANLESALRSTFSNICDFYGIDYSFKIKNKIPEFDYFTVYQISLIIQEVLNNICGYLHKNKITFTVNSNTEKITLSLKYEDTAKNEVYEKIKTVIPIIKTRASFINAEINLKNLKSNRIVMELCFKKIKNFAISLTSTENKKYPIIKEAHA